ncbi:hypothetical protein EIP91_006014 [Steccherinum ochraceum]|uniref:Phosphoglycerate mutase n=1 Tax=Steccherinum ochraceum TaxID=92696 RepID=A0A4V2MVM4_9APHY|nr:hypothetical protein EIP91_006014 [Steccherinum ochraceum]
MAYSCVSGFFSDPQIGPLPPRFGLIDITPERWQKFEHAIAKLNSGEGAKYKVIYLGRHGQGFHNLGKLKYGAEAWDTHWSYKDGDDEMTWGPDALLNETGRHQAIAAREAWRAEVPHGIPLPERCYSSPLRRALETWEITFGGPDEEAVLSEEKRKVLVLENIREECRGHSCDKRSSRTDLLAAYPSPAYTFDPSVTEDDEYWRRDWVETDEDIQRRARYVLDAIFQEDDTYISITSHGGFINGLLSVIGRPSYSLPTGGVLPLVVKYTS